MDDILVRRSEAYAKWRNTAFAEQLGCGIHGVVRVAEDNVNFSRFAVKIHLYGHAYFRERTIYQRLLAHRVISIRGFGVPQLLGWNDDCLAIELTIVDRPFVLDFAGAWLDETPDFSEQFWQDWESEKRDLFRERWAEVQAVLAELRSHGVFMLDVTPTNIAFLE